MFDYTITFDSPWYLLLLMLLPVLWWFSFRSLAGLGRWRRLTAITLRSLVMVLLILALADVQKVRTSDRLTVIYLVDQSLSIPVDQRRAMITYVNAAIERHREQRDRAGVIVFGRDAQIEIPPFDDDVKMPMVIESLLDPEYTNLAGAMKLAQATFPEDAAKRIVLISDGNQNQGNAVEQAQALAGAGVGIDVVPIRYQARSEVVVERMALPSDVRKDEPFEMKVVVNNITEPTAGSSGDVSGRLVISQTIGDQTVVLNPPSEESPDADRVTLPPGKHVYPIPMEIDAANFYTYEARFIPDDPDDDAMPQNNRATAFTHVRGKGQVLLIEDYENKGEFDDLALRLRKQGLEVSVLPSDQLFSRLSELQPYDTILLGNVPREHFTDGQIEMMVSNTQQMGCGLVMLGGPNSFGAGGWTGSKLEEAMPVDFQIKNAKVVPKGALVMLMHACEIAQGNFWQKKVAEKSIEVLGHNDYCGILHWNGNDSWLWAGGLQTVGDNRKKMLGLVSRMTPGDMPQFEGSMMMALQEFRKVSNPQIPGGAAAVKHMIIISDGDPSPPKPSTIAALRALKVTISTVAIGSHGPAESQLLAKLAKPPGKYYAVNNANALPRIFQREARRVARPLIWSEFPVEPRILFPRQPHDIIKGIDSVPKIGGFVFTTVKENSLVDVILRSPVPADAPHNATVLASWVYGAGKTVAFTSDAGARWVNTPKCPWPADVYDKFFGQMVRWSMRPSGDTGKFTVAGDIRDGQVRVVVTALDKDDEFLNFLDMQATAVGPDMKAVPLKLQQTAPGRYVGSFSAEDAGSYFVNIVSTRPPEDGKEGDEPEIISIRTGINVPYSDEFRDRTTDEALLGQLAVLKPKGGSEGQVIDVQPGAIDPIESLLTVNPFRHDLPKARSSQDIWFYLVFLGSCTFFFDVFFRRVQVSFTWVPVMAGRVRDSLTGREPAPAQPEYMRRLAGRKKEVSGQLDQIRAQARFETSEDQPVEAETIEEISGPLPPASRPERSARPSLSGDESSQQESYTERLLKAKKKVWDERDKE